MYAEVTFWLCLFVVAYTYFLYPALLFQLYALTQVRRDWTYLAKRADRRAPSLLPKDLPSVSLIVPVYNEAEHLPGKIASLSQMSYPPEKLEVLFVSDASTDATNDILRHLSDERFRVVVLPERVGKASALNHGVAQTRNAVLVLTDASTLFASDTLLKLVRHFADPQVGVVCGSLNFIETAESRQTEGVYWKYESMLRLMEARLGATLTASGAVYAMRRNCYRLLKRDTILDDFVTPMNAREAGYRVVYDPEAQAVDFAASSVAGEFARRVRIAAGSFKAMKGLANVPLDAITCLALFSHKLLRWILPFLLAGLLISNVVLYSQTIFQITLLGQVIFYLLAAVGFAYRKKERAARLARFCYYLLAMHAAFAVGLFRFLLGRDRAIWQKAN